MPANKPNDANRKKSGGPPTPPPSPPQGQYPPPPPGYNQGYPQQQYGGPPPVTSPPMTVVTVGPSFRQVPVACQCPACQSHIITTVTSKNGMLPWIACLVLFFLFGCVLGCCLIPFCIDDLKDKVHSCPKCGIVLGVYTR